MVVFDVCGVSIVIWFDYIGVECVLYEKMNWFIVVFEWFGNEIGFGLFEGVNELVVDDFVFCFGVGYIGEGWEKLFVSIYCD